MSKSYYCDGSDYRGLNAFAVVRDGVKAYVMYEEPLSVGVIEYKAVHFALKQASPGDKVYTDSEFVVKQLSGEYQVKADHLRTLHHTVKMLSIAKRIDVEWIPREKNPAGKYLDKILKDSKLISTKKKRKKG